MKIQKVNTKSKPVAGKDSCRLPLSEASLSRISKVEKEAIEEMIKERGYPGLIVSNAGFRFAEDRYKELTGKEPIVFDFRNYRPEGRMEEFGRILEMAYGVPYEAGTDICSFFVRNCRMRERNDQEKPLVFLKGLGAITFEETQIFRVALNMRAFHAIVETYIPARIPSEPEKASMLEPLLVEPYDPDKYKMSKERGGALGRIVRDIASRIAGGEVDQINIFGDSQTGKTSTGNRIGSHLNQVFEVRKVCINFDSLDEVEEEVIPAGGLLIVDEASILSLDKIEELRRRYPKLILLTHQPLPGFPEEARIDLNSENIPK